MGKPTVFTDVKVTGALEAGTVKVSAAGDMTAVAKAASTAYTKDEIDAIVDAVNALQVALGRPAT